MIDPLHPAIEISDDAARHDDIVTGMLSLMIAFHCRAVNLQTLPNEKGRTSVGSLSEAMSDEYRATINKFLKYVKLDGPKHIEGVIVSVKDGDPGRIDVYLLYTEDGKHHGYNYILRLDPSIAASYYREIYRKMAKDGRLDAKYLPIDDLDNLAALLEWHVQLEVHVSFELLFPGANRHLN